MEVVERNGTVLFEPVGEAKSQFRRQAANSRCQMGHDDRVDAVGDWVACEYEDGMIPTSSDIGEPDLARFTG